MLALKMRSKRAQAGDSNTARAPLASVTTHRDAVLSQNAN